MQLNILLTKELRETMPDTITVDHNFGTIEVIFPDDEETGKHGHVMVGENTVLTAEQDEFVKWLKPFDGVAVGHGGVPQLEQFNIMHIRDDV